MQQPAAVIRQEKFGFLEPYKALVKMQTELLYGGTPEKNCRRRLNFTVGY